MAIAVAIMIGWLVPLSELSLCGTALASGEKALGSLRVSAPHSLWGSLPAGAELAKGKFLIASRDLRDPNFSETVVLLVDYERGGAMGLIINRPTEVKLAEAFPDMTGVQGRSDRVYIGGPVARGHMLLLIQSDTPPEESRHVFENVYVSSSRAGLERMIDGAKPGERFRVYAGYAGWAPGQLDQEIFRGNWHLLQADAETIFEKASSDIWPELINRSEMLVAQQTSIRRTIAPQWESTISETLFSRTRISLTMILR